MIRDPSILSGGAERAYQTGLALKGGAPAPTQPHTGGTDGQSFAEMLQSATQEAITTLREADTVGRAGMAGKADAQQVVEATLAMETTLRTVVSVRDRLVSAYQEVLRMPI